MQCKGDIRHAFETAKIIVFDPIMCKRPDVPLQAELLALTIQLRTSQSSILQCCTDENINSSWAHFRYSTNDQHSSSSCKQSIYMYIWPSGLWHIIGSNAVPFAVLKA